VLNFANKKEEHFREALHEKNPRTCHKKTNGLASLMHIRCGKMYVAVNEEDDRETREVCMQLGKSGGCTCASPQTEAKLFDSFSFVFWR
jgi:hypothetical protein